MKKIDNFTIKQSKDKIVIEFPKENAPEKELNDFELGTLLTTAIYLLNKE